MQNGRLGHLLAAPHGGTARLEASANRRVGLARRARCEKDTLAACCHSSPDFPLEIACISRCYDVHRSAGVCAGYVSAVDGAAMKNAEGWAVELKGEAIDLDDVREVLQPPFDPWIEDHLTGEDVVIPLLRTGAWASLARPADVARDARRILERLYGAAILVHSDAKPLGIGLVLKFDADGKRIPMLSAASVRLNLNLGRARTRDRMAATTSTAPAESSVQRWLREADADEKRAELLLHLTRADNWYDLFKSAELVRKLAGGETALKTALGPDWPYWRLMFRTANCYRHAPDSQKYPLPTPPAELEEAREFLFGVAPRFL